MSGYLPTFESVAKGAFASAAGLTTFSLGLLYYGQGYLIYPSAFPPGSRTDVPSPKQYGIPYEDLTLDTADRVRIRAYLLVQRKVLPPVPSQRRGNSSSPSVAETDVESDIVREPADDTYAATRPTVVMFHGNGGNVGHRVPLARVFYNHLRCNVFMLEYRGYGLSEGTASEKGIRMDAQAALDYITTHPVLSRTPIVLYGQSIGGAVAIDLASRAPSLITALILENTFLSLPRLIPSAMPALSRVAFLCHQKWDSASKLPLLPPKMPVLMLSGTKDEVVPQAHMHELERGLRHPSAKAASADAVRRPGKMVEFPDGTHNDTCVQEGYWATVAAFLEDEARR